MKEPSSRGWLPGIAILLAGLAIFPVTRAGAEAQVLVSPAKLLAAVTKSIPLLEKSASFTLDERACFTCHHTGHTVLTVNEAWRHRLKVDERNFARQLERAWTELAAAVPRFRDGRILTGKSDEIGLSLCILDVAGWQPDATTAVAVDFLLDHDQELDHWEASPKRPPTVASPFTTTYLVLRGLRRYGTSEQQPRIKARTEAAKAWLLSTTGDETEDHVSRLRALHLLNFDKKTLATEADQLLQAQREDGGWSQLSQMGSDAYATGTALAALLDTGILSPREPAYQKGLDYLLRSQLADGSWQVRKRTHPIQPYFQSGFPHEQDQFISFSATCWATYALLKAIPQTKPPPKAPYLLAHPKVAAQLRSQAQPTTPAKLSPKEVAFFEKKILPVLSAKCYSCHSAKAQTLKAGLHLDTRAGILAGGDSGPAITPGVPKRSLLIQALRGDKLAPMPPKEKLSASVVADFQKWIKMGAPDPRDRASYNRAGLTGSR